MHFSQMPQNCMQHLRFYRAHALLRLRNEAFFLYRNQSVSDHNSRDLLKAAYRRVYRLAILKIVALEYIRESLLSPQSTFFMSIFFPFTGIETGEGEFDIDRIKKISSFIQRKIGQPFPGSEFDLRHDFYRSLMKTFFDSNILDLSSEFRCSKMDSRSSFIVDNVVLIDSSRFTENSVLEDVPIIFIEYALKPLESFSWVHKDQSKMAFVMGLSLYKLIRSFRHKGLEFLQQLFVQGILIGGFDCEFVVMKPQFGQVEIRDGFTFVPFCFVFESNRRTNRFSLFSELELERNPIDDGRLDTWGKSNCYYQTLFDGPELTLGSQVHTLNEDQLEGLNLIQSNYENIIQEENLSNVPEEQATFKGRHDNTSLVVNKTCLRAFDRVRQSAENLTHILVEALEAEENPETSSISCSSSSDKGLDFNEESFNIISSGRSSHSSRTPAKDKLSRSKDSEFKSPSKKRPKSGMSSMKLDINDLPSRIHISCNIEDRLSDADLITIKEYFNSKVKKDENIILVVKQESKYEVNIYQHERIKASAFIPLFHNSRVLSHNSIIILELEEIYTLRDFVCAESCTKEAEVFLFDLARIFLNCLGGLRDLHAAGFVHSDISINNIGYNKSTGIWQIFDFNQSMPIDESLNTKRSDGTEYFMSEYSMETGYFRPLDDYVALVRSVYYCCLWGLRDLESTAHKYFSGIFAKIKSAKDCRDSSLWYNEAFEIFKNIHKDNQISSELETDSSYLMFHPLTEF